MKGEDKYLYRALDSTGQTIELPQDGPAVSPFLVISASISWLALALEVCSNSFEKYCPGHE